MKKSAVFLCFFLTLTAGMSTAENLASLFPLRADIVGEGPGLSRLELTPEVLGACRADLADLRVLSTSGTEIPYLIDSPDPTDRHLQVDYRANPAVLSSDRAKKVFDRRTTTYREQFRLSIPLQPDDIAAWELVLSVGRKEFVAKIDITAVAQDGQRTRILEKGSAFRLPAADAERLRFVIPLRDATMIEVDLEGQDQGYLVPAFRLEGSRLLPTPGTGAIDLDQLERRDHPGHTELVFERPRGFVPRRLRVNTTTGAFHRKVTVWDEGPGALAEPLGARALLRIDAIAPVEVQEVPLRPARGDRLRLVIENLESPALDNLTVSAVMPSPVVVFSMPGDTLAATLVFGGGRAHRPHYDLLALDPRQALPTTGDEAGQAIALLDPSRARSASLGAVVRNPEYDASPALAFAMHAGAEIDSGLYSHRRRIEVTPSAEGLSRLRLEPVDLALLRPDLGDLRIVDPQGRQWAYLKQNRTRTALIELRLQDHQTKDGISTYRLEIPDGPVTTSRIDLETPAPFFDRDFRLLGTLENGKQQVLTTGRLKRRIGDPRPASLLFAAHRLEALELEVTDGNDSALALGKITARVGVADIYIAATAGAFDLLLGHPEAEPPRYELERIRSTVLAVPAGDVAVGPIEANPAFSSTRRLTGAANSQKILLWVILGLAVLTMAVLTLRAARQE